VSDAATPEDPYLAVLLGEPWPGVPLPMGDSAGWHWPFLVVLGTGERGTGVVEWFRQERKRIGLIQSGPMGVLVLGTGLGVVDCPRPYLVGDPVPDVEPYGGDHVLWKVVLVQRGVVADLTAFTTSPAFTKHLRRVFAEQRARGPLTRREADVAIARFQVEVPDERALWRRCLVTSRAGD
jgi:hypothetical protein